MWASDIAPQAEGIHQISYDKLGFDELVESDYIITNPPWSRNILHPMIDFFSEKRPTWLLFDADWVHTRQSAPYLDRLQTVVSVGRIKWFGTMSGKDNCAWHLFDKGAKKPYAEFYGRS